MAAPPAAVAAVRLAVRRSMADLPPGAVVLVACSGGPDSLALAAATAFEARSACWRAGLVTVDHGLQPGSSAVADRVTEWALATGFDPVEVCRVVVGSQGGPEAAARTARYAGLDAAADRHGAAVILLGHTLDDQAETVLLGLARGSGARSLAGMAPVRGRYRRPLLGLTRAVTAEACAGLDPWADPHNADDAFTRVRVRAVLRSLEDAAPGATVGLARSADLIRADADCLDGAAGAARARVTGAGGALDCAALAAEHAALRTRILRIAALAAGVPAGALGSAHVCALDALVVAWSGQGPVSLPGGIEASRAAGRLSFADRIGSSGDAVEAGSEG